MGNCFSDSNVEQEVQRQRLALATAEDITGQAPHPSAYGQPIYGTVPGDASAFNHVPVGQQAYIPAGMTDGQGAVPMQQFGQPVATQPGMSFGGLSHGAVNPLPGAPPIPGIVQDTTADDAIPVISGSGQIARKSGEVLVISYDLGTTASGCAYMYRDADGNIGFGPEFVDQWPGQGARSQGKNPSILLYNREGQCLPEWGFECLAPKFSPSRLAASGIHKVEWYKLHIDPAGVPPEHLSGPTRRLPPGVSAWQVYTDYLQKLHTAATYRLQTKRGTDLFHRLTAQDRVQYILTIPAAWQKPSIVGELRKCAVKAGLIKDIQSAALDFCSEPEASALECYNIAPQSLASGDLFSVIDAGGGTVDFTTYQVLSTYPALAMKEVDVRADRCLYRGATFVDQSFEAFLHKKLSSAYPSLYEERHLIRGTQEFSMSTKLLFSAADQQSVFLPLSDGDEFDQGCIELQWAEIEQCFKPHVDKIIEVAKAQVNTSVGRSKVVFCCGGFGSNDYLRGRLQYELGGIQVLQPGDKSAGSRAVALGATRYGIFRNVQSRTSTAWYGVKAFRIMSPSDKAIPGAAQHTSIGNTGREILDNIFSVVLPIGESVEDDEWKSSQFNIQISDNAQNTRQGKLLIYETSQPHKPMFIDEPSVKFMCQIDVYIPPHSQGKAVVSTSGEVLRSYGVVVLLSLGRADLRSRVLLDGVEAGGATITWEK